MKYCPKCETVSSESDVFCYNCGRKLVTLIEPASGIDHSSEPTRKMLRRKVLPIILIALSSVLSDICFFIALFILDDALWGLSYDFTPLIVFLSLTLLCFAGGLVLLIVTLVHNKKIARRLQAQRCEVDCPVCGNNIQYSGIETKASMAYKNGYIRCPKCGTAIGHSVKYIMEIGDDTDTDTDTESEY